MHYAKFLFPLDAIHEWNRIYGRRGFHQFQCLVPFEGGASALRRLLDSIAQSGRGSFLAVLKAMGERGAGYPVVPRPGLHTRAGLPERARCERVAGPARAHHRRPRWARLPGQGRDALPRTAACDVPRSGPLPRGTGRNRPAGPARHPTWLGAWRSESPGDDRTLAHPRSVVVDRACVRARGEPPRRGVDAGGPRSRGPGRQRGRCATSWCRRCAGAAVRCRRRRLSSGLPASGEPSRARCSTSFSPSAACPTRMRWTAILQLLIGMIDSNYSGPVALLQGLAGSFEAQRGGRVVIVGSVAGDPRSPQELSLRVCQSRAGAIRRRVARPPSPDGCARSRWSSLVSWTQR